MAKKPPNQDLLSSPSKRCGLIALLGLTNSGKSTLLNRLVGAKVAITSHKVQTTRAPVRGITIEGLSQLIFVDTPGIFSPKCVFDKVLVGAAMSSARDADVVVLLVDATKGFNDKLDHLCRTIETISAPKILVLNKIDDIPQKEKLLPFVAEFRNKINFQKLFMISALEGDGVVDFKKYVAEVLPQGPWLYPAEDISDAPLRVFAAEITREKIYQYLHMEIPYATAVVTTEWKNLKKGSVRIEQTIYVEKESQKKIIIGKSGQSIKTISSTARAELSLLLDTKVDLFLFVKVRENWSTSPEHFREVGLEYSKK